MSEHDYPECIEDDFDRQDEPEQPDDRERPEPEAGEPEREALALDIEETEAVSFTLWADGLIDKGYRRQPEPREVTTVEWRCKACGSKRWVQVSLNGGWTKSAQCVPCGRVQGLPVTPSTEGGES